MSDLTDPTITQLRELKPCHSDVKSFYGKAKTYDDGEHVSLFSFDVLVVRLSKKTGEYVLFKSKYSSTNTAVRHIIEFLQQAGYPPLSKVMMARGASAILNLKTEVSDKDTSALTQNMIEQTQGK
jgi:hypothetical protein